MDRHRGFATLFAILLFFLFGFAIVGGIAMLFHYAPKFLEPERVAPRAASPAVPDCTLSPGEVAHITAWVQGNQVVARCEIYRGKS